MNSTTTVQNNFKLFVLHTFARHSDLADSGFVLLLGVRLRHDEGEDANSSEEDDDLHSDGESE